MLWELENKKTGLLYYLNNEDMNNINRLRFNKRFKISKVEISFIENKFKSFGSIYIKVIKNKVNSFSGLNGRQSYELEKKILQRLKGAKHFPTILGYNDKKMILVMTNCGKTLKDVKVNNIEEQVIEIVDILINKRVRQLDESMNNNLLVKNGIVYMIDFDIACIDDQPINNKLSILYNLRPTDEDYRNNITAYIMKHYNLNIN